MSNFLRWMFKTNDLKQAALGRDVEQVRYLLETGIHPDNRRDEDNATVLLLVFLSHNRIGEGGGRNQPFGHQNEIEIIKLLLDAGADPNVQDKNGYSPLMIACSWYHYPNKYTFIDDPQTKPPLWPTVAPLEYVKLLIEAGADPNLQRLDDGYTALNDINAPRVTSSGIKATRELIKYLIEAGADPTIRNNDGTTIMEKNPLVGVLYDNFRFEKLKSQQRLAFSTMMKDSKHDDIPNDIITRTLRNLDMPSDFGSNTAHKVLLDKTNELLDRMTPEPPDPGVVAAQKLFGGSYRKKKRSKKRSKKKSKKSSKKRSNKRSKKRR